jgi:hypothetical protein
MNTMIMVILTHDWSTQVEPGLGVTVSGADAVLAKL